MWERRTHCQVGYLVPDSEPLHTTIQQHTRVPWPCLGAMAAQLDTSVEHATAADDLHTSERGKIKGNQRGKPVHSS